MDNKNIVIKHDEIRKILVIQFEVFGDVFLTTSIFESIKKKYPQALVHYLVREPYHITIQDHPFIDEIITFPKCKGFKYFVERLKLFRRIRSLKYDLIIDQQNNPGSQQVTLFSGAKYRLGYTHGQMTFVYNLLAEVGEDRYTPSKRFDLLKPLGIKEQPWKFHYTILPQSDTYIDQWLGSTQLTKNEFIVISPGSPSRKKKWNLQSFATVADRIIRELKIPVVFLWAPNEWDEVQSVMELMQEEALAAPHTSINQACSLIQHSMMLLCNDGGMNHFAVATETKTLALFGNTNPLPWSPAPYFKTHHHLFNPDFPSMTDDTFGISTDEVFNKIREIIQK